MDERNLTALAAWGLVIALLVFGGAPMLRVRRPLVVSVALLTGLAALCALSSSWSGAPERSLNEADRVIAYLGLFLAALALSQTGRRRQRFVEGLAAAAGMLALLGLASRLLPGVTDHLPYAISPAASDPGASRLTYPLGYWNADGVMFGIAVALLAWATRHGSTALRWAATATLPATMLAAYFTYSRGGVLAGVLSLAVLLALSRERLWYLAVTAISLAAVVPAVAATQSRRELADGIAGQVASDQGVTVFVILAAGTALALVATAMLSRAATRRGGLPGRELRLAIAPRDLRRIALVVLAAVAALAIVLGGRAWDRFSDPDIRSAAENPEGRLTQISGAGRHDFWRVAADGFADEPLLGSGAGTFEFLWDRDRSIDFEARDAHSLYLEAFAELGVVGGLLTLAMVAAIVWFGFCAWRNSRGAERERSALLFSVLVAMAVAFGLDWFWELPALGAVFFLVAGVLVGVRCEQLTPAGGGIAAPGPSRNGLVLAGLGLAWIATIALVGPLLTQRKLEASRDAVAAGNLADAVGNAEAAQSIEPWAASPRLQLALIAELQGDYAEAESKLSEAIAREEGNWQLYYARFRVRTAVGDPAAREDFAKAVELNPRSPVLTEGAAGTPQESGQ